MWLYWLFQGNLCISRFLIIPAKSLRPWEEHSHRFQGLGCEHLCRVALFYPRHLYSWDASSVSTWFRSESDSSPFLWSKVWAVPPCLAVDVRKIKFLDSVSFWSPSLGTQPQENIESLHTCTRTWTLAHTHTHTHTHSLRIKKCEALMMQELGCPFFSDLAWVHSGLWALDFGLCDFLALRL